MKMVTPACLFQKLFKTGSLKQGRLLGLDVGHKYVGLAVSDVHNKIASPVSVLVRKKTNIDLMATDFKTLVSHLSLAGFVVGYPFSLKGQSSIEAVQVRVLMEDLRKTGELDGLSYTYWDENYTSKCVQALLNPLNLDPMESKTIMDKFAAVGILQVMLQTLYRSDHSRLLHPGPTGESQIPDKQGTDSCDRGYLDNMHRNLKSGEMPDE